jgi:uncharacterized membrane protein
MADNQSVALAILVASETPNYYSGMLPSLFTIATFTGSDEEKAQHTIRWIRRGEVQGTAQAVLLSVAASVLSENPWPFILTMVMVTWYLSQYEYALREGLRNGPAMDMDNQ